MKNYNKTIKNFVLGTVLVGSLASCQKDFYEADLLKADAQLERVVAAGRSEIEKLQAEVMALTTDNNNLEAEILTLTTEVKSLFVSSEDLQSDAAANQNTISNFQNGLTVSLNMIETLENEKSMLDAEIVTLNADVATLVSSNDVDSAEIASLSSAVKDALEVEALLRADIKHANDNVKVVVQTYYNEVGTDISQEEIDALALAQYNAFKVSDDQVYTFARRSGAGGDDVVIKVLNGTPNFVVDQTNPAGDFFANKATSSSRSINIGRVGAVGTHVITVTDEAGATFSISIEVQ